jgi:hypothetical protein
MSDGYQEKANSRIDMKSSGGTDEWYLGELILNGKIAWIYVNSRWSQIIFN